MQVLSVQGFVDARFVQPGSYENPGRAIVELHAAMLRCLVHGWQVLASDRMCGSSAPKDVKPHTVFAKPGT